jgi:YVTN family beta-propeller protein
MKYTSLLTAFFLAGTVVAQTSPQHYDFETANVGAVPKRWTATQTGTGTGSLWKVAEDKSAPKGSKVLVQTASGPNALFNLCVLDDSSFHDVDITLAFKAIAGKTDQGGGAVWRYRDANNYYIARYNPLENNYRLYKVVEGKRTQLATKEDLKAPANEWHTLRITMVGTAIACQLNGKTELEAKDETFPNAGQVGLWTKADAQTAFDDFRVESATLPPKSVLVVNTQDSSVSHVDLATMKELKRYPVGSRPYGIAVSRDAKTIAVGVEDEECVKFYSWPDFQLKGSTKIGKMFNDHIVLTQDGKSVMVANFYSDDVVGIDIGTMQESFRIKDCSAPHVVKYGSLKKHAFVTCKKVTGIAIIDPEARKQVKVIPLNVNPRSLTFSPDESSLYFGSFWVDGFYRLDVATGKVTKLFKFDPPKENTEPQEVTYHGVEMMNDRILLAANEGRSYVDAVDVTTGKLTDRLMDVSKPCCVERIPGTNHRVLISNIGDGTVQLAELTAEGKLKSLGKATVGKAPKRVAFLP